MDWFLELLELLPTSCLENDILTDKAHQISKVFKFRWKDMIKDNKYSFGNEVDFAFPFSWHSGNWRHSWNLHQEYERLVAKSRD